MIDKVLKRGDSTSVCLTSEGKFWVQYVAIVCQSERKSFSSHKGDGPLKEKIQSIGMVNVFLYGT